MDNKKKDDGESGRGRHEHSVKMEYDPNNEESSYSHQSSPVSIISSGGDERSEEINHPNPPPPYEESLLSPPKPPSRKHRRNDEGRVGVVGERLSNVPVPVTEILVGSASHPVDENIRGETDESSLPPSSTSSPRKYFLPMEVYATIVAAFSFLCIGLQRAYTSPAIGSMKMDHTGFFSGENRLTSYLMSWIAATPSLGGFFGTILSSVSLHYMGRQKTLVFLTFPYILGWLLIAFAKNVGMIVVGRGLTGLAGGFSYCAAPIYVSECVRAKVRGFLGFVPPMMLSLGILLGFALSTLPALEWKDLALLMTTFPLLLLVFALAVPESPSWLLQRGREEEAVESLHKLRGDDNNAETEAELVEMKTVMQKKRASLASLGERRRSSTFMDFVFQDILGRREIRFPVFISVSLMVLQQAVGGNIVIYYLSVILNEADPYLQNATFINSFNSEAVYSPGIDHRVASVIFGLVQFFAFFLSLPLIDYVGRRVLLLVSSLLMIFPHVLLGLYFWIKMNPDMVIHVYKFDAIVRLTYSWLPLACLCAFIAAYAIGMGPIPFIIMSEVFPSSSRSFMVAVVSSVNNLTLFFLIRVFPTFMDLLGPHIVFWTLAGFCLMSFFLVAIFVPETKGKTLAEIELEFKENDVEEEMKCENCKHCKASRKESKVKK